MLGSHFEGMTPAPQEIRLVVYVNGQTRVHPLPQRGSVMLGRALSNEIRVEDPSISRQHLKITVQDGSIEVEDLGSANGTVLLMHPDSGRAFDETQTRTTDTPLEPGVPRRIQPGTSLRAGLVLLFVEVPGQEAMRQTVRPPARIPQEITAAAPILVDEKMRRIYALAARAAASEITVLILGETGVGKEVLAESIHRHSPRASKPFLRLNCAALPENLLESELFGHEKGAFTGATGAKLGLLESTDGGTVFLDEVGELPLATQVKLLRVLEERVVMRVGSTKPRPIDVRFVTATNRDLKREVDRGAFRGDLFFRINGVTLRIPPLRERPAEIEPLARHFLKQFCARSGIPMPEFSPEAIKTMASLPWPGNVRELRNVMERVPLLCGTGPILSEHVMPDHGMSPSTLMAADEWGSEVTDVMDVFSFEPRQQVDERERILRALAACGGNQTRAARMLGVSRRTLSNRLNDYNLPRPRKGK